MSHAILETPDSYELCFELLETLNRDNTTTLFCEDTLLDGDFSDFAPDLLSHTIEEIKEPENEIADEKLYKRITKPIVLKKEDVHRNCKVELLKRDKRIFDLQKEVTKLKESVINYRKMIAALSELQDDQHTRKRARKAASIII